MSVSVNFDATQAADVTRSFDVLLQRPLESVRELESFILDSGYIVEKIHDTFSRINVACNSNTQDLVAKDKFNKMVSEILPLVHQFNSNLGKLIVHHPKAKELPASYALYLKLLKSDLALFQEINIPLLTEDELFSNEYSSITGALSTRFQGEDRTRSQLAKFLESADRTLRQEAYEARANITLQAAPLLDELYLKMLTVRHQIALNAGFKNYRDYKFKSLNRFDYTAEDCFQFHEAIEKLIVPLMNTLAAERKAALSITSIKPWDTLVGIGIDIPAPFSDTDELTKGCLSIFKKVDPELGDFFQDMIDKNLLDLPARKGKAGGGFCTRFGMQKVPFIFMNAAGSRSDVETLLHEGGHAFHYYFSRNIPLMSDQHTGSEFAEVASMSMELLARPFMNEFYSEEILPQVLRDQLVRALDLFPFIAMLDSFQHWVYTAGPNGGVVTDTQAWRKKWVELDERYKPSIDWTGLESVRECGWQFLHVFKVPFYFVEYGIAQVGALAVWAHSLKDYPGTVANYKAALKLGGTKPLPELFKVIGANFGLDQKTLAPLVSAVNEAI